VRSRGCLQGSTGPSSGSGHRGQPTPTRTTSRRFFSAGAQRPSASSTARMVDILLPIYRGGPSNALIHSRKRASASTEQALCSGWGMTAAHGFRGSPAPAPAPKWDPLPDDRVRFIDWSSYILVRPLRALSDAVSVPRSCLLDGVLQGGFVGQYRVSLSDTRITQCTQEPRARATSESHEREPRAM